MDISSVDLEILPLIPIGIIVSLFATLLGFYALYRAIRLKLKRHGINKAFRGHRCYLEQLLTKKYISYELKVDIRISLANSRRGLSDTAEAEYFLANWIIPLCNKLLEKYPLTEDDYIYWTNPDL